MRHTNHFLMTVLHKVLCTSVFEQLNADNPLSTQEKYTRTDSMIIYKESAHPNPTRLLESNKLLVGIIDNSGKMFVCVHTLKGDKMSLNFTQLILRIRMATGATTYSSVSIKNTKRTCKDRETLLNMSLDYILLLKDPTSSKLGISSLFLITSMH